VPEPVPQPEPSKSERPFLDRDLYCLQCGYNLRGLSGDPVRCPECGYDNPIGDVEIPADLITQQLKKMEPGAAVFAALWLVVFAWFDIVNLLEVTTASKTYCLLVPTALALTSWLYLALVAFPKGCLRKPGWFAALMVYHFWALLLVVGVIVLPILVCILSANFFHRLGVIRVEVKLGAAVIGVALYILALRTCVPWAYRRATKAMTPLQREVAVTIARTEIRKRLARKPRNSPLSG
jgi:hypothetical protein